MTVWLALALLPAVSVQVLLTTCPMPSAVKVAVLTVHVDIETASVALKLTVTLLLFQPLLLAQGSWLALTTGGVVSTTCTTKVVGAAALPAASAALQVTVPLPSAKSEPEAGKQVTTTVLSTASAALGLVYRTTAPAALLASAVTSAWAAITGAVVSCTVTLKDALLRLPAVSVAVQSTVVVPSGKVLPEAGVQLGVTLASTLSVAVALKLATAPLASIAAIVILLGTSNTGAVLSCTVTVKPVFAPLPATSVAVQATVVVPSANRLPDTGAQFTLAIPDVASLAGGVA